jgi:hypothetical protein
VKISDRLEDFVIKTAARGQLLKPNSLFAFLDLTVYAIAWPLYIERPCGKFRGLQLEKLGQQDL